MIAPAPTTAEARRVNLVLTREVSCIRALAWRCDLPVATDWPRLAEALVGDGMTRLASVRGLIRLATSAGDELLVVAATGRVQIRVHYTIPEHERRFAAERVFQRVVYAFLAL